ncbi:LAFA_0E18888g1_1 [Lachancea sp. 'fantastica']|nr:LAFA_0E18888g1_1 [Lachancea sp. 'fantastica']
MTSAFEEPQLSLDDTAEFLGVASGSLNGIDHSVTAAIAAKAQEFRQLQAQTLESSVVIDELKSASGQKLEVSNARALELEQQVQKLRTEFVVLEEARCKLEMQFQAAETSLETSQLQNQSLVEQKQMLESTKNDLGKLLNEKIQDNMTLQRETDHLLKEAHELRDKNLELEKFLREAKSRELSDRGELQQLAQELRLSQSNNSWLESQLAEVTANFNKYRQKSQHETSQLLEKTEANTSELHSTRQTIGMLREQNTSLTEQLDARLGEIKRLTDTSNSDRADFTREMALKQHLTDLLEGQVKSLKDELGRKGPAGQLQSDTSTLIDELSQCRTQLAEKEVEIEKLQNTVQELLDHNGKAEEVNGGNQSPTLSANKSVSIPKLYGDISVLKKQLIHEKRQKEHLQNQVEGFVLELENKIPMLSSFKDRNEMLEKELIETSYMLESVSRDRSEFIDDIRRNDVRVRDYEAQISELTKQRTDLARQIQFLLIQASVKGDSKGPLTDEETAFVQKILNSEKQPTNHDTQAVISQRLVVFQDIVELQTKNSELLVTVRGLADKLEREERDANGREDVVDKEVISDAKEAITRLQEHVQDLELKIEIISKERDALRTIRLNAGPRDGSSNNHASDASNAKKLEQMEEQLQIARREAETNLKILNTQVNDLLKTRADLLLEVERERSSRTLADERLRLANETLKLAKRESKEVASKCDKLQDTLIRQDARTQETVTDIIDCKSHIARLSSELKNSIANSELLRASHEKDRRTIEQLTSEKSELSVLVAQLQTLQKEREALIHGTESSFEGKIEILNQEIRQLRSQLVSKAQDLEAFVSATDSKSQWYQNKIDSLNESLSETTAKLNLQMDALHHLKAQSASSEPSAQVPSTLQSYDNQTGNEQTPSLRIEIGKLKLHLQEAYSQVDEYKSMNASTEECLSSVTEAYEQLKSDHSRESANAKEQEKVLKEEISTLTTSLSSLASKLKDEREQLTSKNDDITNRMSAFKESQQSIDTLKEHYQKQLDQLTFDLKEQSALTSQTHKKYEEELQRHADASRVMNRFREESETIKHQLQTAITAHKDLQKTLESREEEWVTKKRDLESQLDAANHRIEDLLTQNRLLFNQVEFKFSEQSSGTYTENNDSQSRDLILSLRRECDICRAKLEVVDGERKKLQRKLRISESELLTAKEELNSYESTAARQSIMTEEHEKVLEELNQLNLLRESNITLRSNLQTKSEQNSELEKKVEELQASIGPTENELSSLKHSIAAKDKQIELASEEVDRWKTRTQDILHTYERVDPEEHRKLIEELTQAKAELASKIELNTEIEARFQRLKKQARERLDAAKTLQTTLTADLNAQRSEKQELETALKREREDIEKLNEKIANLESNESNERPSESELESLVQKLTAAEAKVEELQKISSESSDVSKLHSEHTQLKQRISELESLLENSRIELAQLKDVKASTEDHSAEIEKTRKELTIQSEKFILEKEAEIRSKFEEMHAEQQRLFEGKIQEASNQQVPDIGALRKEWEAEHEQETQKRIDEANELLRKRIRLPTEERINKIIESRKTDLEREFEKRVQDRALEISAQSRNDQGIDSAQVSERHQQELDIMKATLKKQMDEEMAQLKQKAFNEGQQKASMKSTLLERKIAKLEAQLKSAGVGTAVSSAPSSAADGDVSQIEKPARITEISPAAKGSTEALKTESERSLVPIQTAPLVMSPTNEHQDAKAAVGSTVPNEPPVLLQSAEGLKLDDSGVVSPQSPSKRPSEDHQLEGGPESKKNKPEGES